MIIEEVLIAEVMPVMGTKEENRHSVHSGSSFLYGGYTDLVIISPH
jgi:hypothetical protein